MNAKTVPCLSVCYCYVPFKSGNSPISLQFARLALKIKIKEEEKDRMRERFKVLSQMNAYKIV